AAMITGTGRRRDVCGRFCVRRRALPAGGMRRQAPTRPRPTMGTGRGKPPDNGVCTMPITLSDGPRADREPSTSTSLLEVRDLHVSFPKYDTRLEVVHGISFDVHPGETV